MGELFQLLTLMSYWLTWLPTESRATLDASCVALGVRVSIIYKCANIQYRSKVLRNKRLALIDKNINLHFIVLLFYVLLKYCENLKL